MTDLQIYLLFIAKFIKSIWPILAYIVVGLAVLGRRNRIEKERLAKASKRDKPERSNNKKYIA